MGFVPRGTVKRLFLLHLIECFDRAVFGRLRLQKVTYFAERDCKLRPLAFKHYDRGQYSEEIPYIVEQLVSMGYISAVPLGADGMGNAYYVNQRKLADYHAMALDRLSRELKSRTEEAVHQYGYLSEDELLDKAYCDELLQQTPYNYPIFEANIEEMVAIEGLSDEDVDELILSLNPEFISAARLIVRGLETTEIDLDRVRKVAALL